ncbi:hypothetical protein QF032_007936 [Streptomyces achromogenes]|uniref:hypothetical protein n=1 Tax=Streptomyces achromogenes TaxID=67255 RepID=UPI00277E97B9|nr:hypothetical protein [Streptomyces achromogenes]MDQ0836092.1 hypothetical protein [Streptomyces achromogenes]
MRVTASRLREPYGYFAWALENLPATARHLERSGGQVQPRDVERAVRRSFVLETTGAGRAPQVDLRRPDQYWSRGRGPDAAFPQPPGTQANYADVLRASPQEALGMPDRHYSADVEPRGPAVDDAAYRLMLNGFLMAFLHAESCLPWLGVLLLRGPLDRQFTISRFLRLMTWADVDDSPGDRPPGRESVQAWAGAIHGGGVSFRPGHSWQEAVSAYRGALPHD